MDLSLFWHKALGRPYRLHTTVRGERDKPIIVLLHGIAASSDKWSELLPMLELNYRCITIDLLGFGRSPKPQYDIYTMEQHVRHIEAALRRLHLHEPFILAGHSLGSLLATRYARRHSNRVKQLLLLSPPVYAPLETITSRSARQRTALYFRLYKFFRVHPRITPQNFERLKRLLPLPRSVINHPETWLPFERSLEHCIEQQTLLADIEHTQAPIDIFYGTLDSVIVPYNILQLKNVQNVKIHRLARVNHQISARYALAVTIFLTS